MSRGGFRENAPLFKPSWVLGTTKTIRIPIILSDILLEFARGIDKCRKEGLPPEDAKVEILKVAQASIDKWVDEKYIADLDRELKI